MGCVAAGWVALGCSGVVDADEEADDDRAFDDECDAVVDEEVGLEVSLDPQAPTTRTAEKSPARRAVRLIFFTI